MLLATTTNSEECANTIKRIGIIGGGAAGLATARAFLRANTTNQWEDVKSVEDGANNNVQFDVTVLETRDSIGGVWKYDEDDEAASSTRSAPVVFYFYALAL